MTFTCSKFERIDEILDKEDLLQPGGDGIQLLDHGVNDSLNLVNGESDVEIQILLEIGKEF